MGKDNVAKMSIKCHYLALIVAFIFDKYYHIGLYDLLKWDERKREEKGEKGGRGIKRKEIEQGIQKSKFGQEEMKKMEIKKWEDMWAERKRDYYAKKE